MNAPELLRYLRSRANPANAAGMQRFAVSAGEVLGIKIPELRTLAKGLEKDAALAQALWASGIHEARLLALFISDGRRLPAPLVEDWLKDVRSWDLCDQLCIAIAQAPYAFDKADEWSRRETEFEKRAGFSLMAVLAVHRKKDGDERFLPFLERVEAEACDARNFVKKSVNWALRQIGKRSAHLYPLALAAARRLTERDCRAAQWIARDALKELERKVK